MHALCKIQDSHDKLKRAIKDANEILGRIKGQSRISLKLDEINPYFEVYPEDGPMITVPIKTAKLIKMALEFLEVEV